MVDVKKKEKLEEDEDEEESEEEDEETKKRKKVEEDMWDRKHKKLMEHYNISKNVGLNSDFQQDNKDTIAASEPTVSIDMQEFEPVAFDFTEQNKRNKKMMDGYNISNYDYVEPVQGDFVENDLNEGISTNLGIIKSQYDLMVREKSSRGLRRGYNLSVRNDMVGDSSDDYLLHEGDPKKIMERLMRLIKAQEFMTESIKQDGKVINSWDGAQQYKLKSEPTIKYLTTRLELMGVKVPKRTIMEVEKYTNLDMVKKQVEDFSEKSNKMMKKYNVNFEIIGYSPDGTVYKDKKGQRYIDK